MTCDGFEGRQERAKPGALVSPEASGSARGSWIWSVCIYVFPAVSTAVCSYSLCAGSFQVTQNSRTVSKRQKPTLKGWAKCLLLRREGRVGGRLDRLLVSYLLLFRFEM